MKNPLFIIIASITISFLSGTLLGYSLPWQNGVSPSILAQTLNNSCSGGWIPHDNIAQNGDSRFFCYDRQPYVVPGPLPNGEWSRLERQRWGIQPTPRVLARCTQKGSWYAPPRGGFRRGKVTDPNSGCPQAETKEELRTVGLTIQGRGATPIINVEGGFTSVESWRGLSPKEEREGRFRLELLNAQGASVGAMYFSPPGFYSFDGANESFEIPSEQTVYLTLKNHAAARQARVLTRAGAIVMGPQPLE